MLIKEWFLAFLQKEKKGSLHKGFLFSLTWAEWIGYAGIEDHLVRAYFPNGSVTSWYLRVIYGQSVTIRSDLHMDRRQ